MKTGIVLEGGAMRGLFTAGVLDVFMENGITFDAAVGVSAGAVFGCNLKSHQIGRSIRYNKRFCRDKRYVSFIHWILTGDLYPVEFCYKTLPWEIDIFDRETYEKDPMEFYVTVTNVQTGKPEYVKCEKGDEDDLKWFQASASMPVFANPVLIGDTLYSDGGTSDSVPLKFFEETGYDKIVVVTTQPKGYRKSKYKGLKLIKIILRKYPKLYEAMENRHIMYNETMDYIDKQEAAGKILVIRPTTKLKVKPAETNPDELERTYQNGREVGGKVLDSVKEFISK